MSRHTKSAKAYLRDREQRIQARMKSEKPTITLSRADPSLSNPILLTGQTLRPLKVAGSYGPPSGKQSDQCKLPESDIKLDPSTGVSTAVPSSFQASSTGTVAVTTAVVPSAPNLTHREAKIYNAKKYESDLMDIEKACLINTARRQTSILDSKTYHLFDKHDTLYTDTGIQLMLLNRLKLLIAIFQRKCYEHDGPDYLRTLVFGDVKDNDHALIKKWLIDLLQVSMKSLHNSYQPISLDGSSETVEYGEVPEYPMDLETSDSSYSE